MKIHHCISFAPQTAGMQLALPWLTPFAVEIFQRGRSKKHYCFSRQRGSELAKTPLRAMRKGFTIFAELGAYIYDRPGHKNENQVRIYYIPWF